MIFDALGSLALGEIPFPVAPVVIAQGGGARPHSWVEDNFLLGAEKKRTHNEDDDMVAIWLMLE